jgi:hypothetical protein
MDSSTKRTHAEKVRRRLSSHVAAVGFHRTKSSFWTRPTDALVEFVHLHLYRHGPLFRVHLGLRVLNDPFEAVALNGPSSHPTDPYNVRFDEGEESLVRCALEIARYCQDVGEPWFAKWRDRKLLLYDPESPLQTREREGLEAALRGEDQDQRVERSRHLLGVA